MTTLEKTINLLNTMPEYQVESIYSFARFLRSQNKSDQEIQGESIDNILDSLVGVISDDGRTLEEYREERRKERYGLAENADGKILLPEQWISIFTK